MNKVILFLLCMVPTLMYAQLPINENASNNININEVVQGALLVPARPSETLIIIIPGAGAIDRDGNSQMARNNSLKKLAQGLTNAGYATFRYDKRVLTLLKKRALQERKLRFDDFIKDASSVISYFRKQERFSQIYLLGHGQGALVGMVAAQENTVNGMISINGSGQSIDQTIISQIALQMPDIKEQAITAFTTLKENGSVANYSPALSSIFREDVQPFMASWMHYNPQIEISNLTIPTLIVGGTKDLQTSQEEAQLLKKANPAAQLVIIENMNNMFFEITGDDLENSKSYNETNREVMPILIETITSFINLK